jgi:hypothetical protein
VAGSEDRALIVVRARLGAALSATALEARKAIDDRLDTETFDAGVRDAGIVMFLAAAVAMRLAGTLAHAIDAGLLLATAFWAFLAPDVTGTVEHHDRSGRESERGSQHATPRLTVGEPASQLVDSMVARGLHRESWRTPDRTDDTARRGTRTIGRWSFAFLTRTTKVPFLQSTAIWIAMIG